jgi:hypothetical protein
VDENTFCARGDVVKCRTLVTLVVSKTVDTQYHTSLVTFGFTLFDYVRKEDIVIDNWMPTTWIIKVVVCIVCFIAFVLYFVGGQIFSMKMLSANCTSVCFVVYCTHHP